MLRAAVWMALIYGLGLAAFETMINWGQWQWWPWWLVDYVAASLLLWGAYLGLRGRPNAKPVLCLGWGFALGMMWMSLAGNIEQGTDPDRAARVAGFYVMLIGTSIAYCMVGLLLSLTARSRV